MSLTLDELGSHHFKCAEIIRNAVDKTDYKDFILTLVFYRAVKETYQEVLEVEGRRQEAGRTSEFEVEARKSHPGCPVGRAVR